MTHQQGGMTRRFRRPSGPTAYGSHDGEAPLRREEEVHTEQRRPENVRAPMSPVRRAMQRRSVLPGRKAFKTFQNLSSGSRGRDG